MIASLPMYNWPEVRADTDAFWAELGQKFRDTGLEAPHHLTHSDNDAADWLSPNLFMSQTCGYPFATKLVGRVKLLGTPHYAIEGCSGPEYSSAIIVRKDAMLDDLNSLKNTKLAINSRDSLSGFRCLTPLRGDADHWFGSIVQSGGHRNSARMVSRGDADCAAIDAVCWRLFQEFDAEDSRKLRVLQWTPLLPALPFITSSGWSNSDLNRIRSSLAGFVNASSRNSSIGSIAISGLTLLGEESYAPLSSL